MFESGFKAVLIALFLCGLLSGCAELKDAGKTIGHTSRDAVKVIGHGTRDAAKAVAEGTNRVVKSVAEDEE